MFKMLVALLASALLLCGVAFTQAMTVTQTGVTMTVSYIEPNTDALGGALLDFSHVEVTVSSSDGVLHVETIPASSVNGGMTIVQEMSFMAPPGQHTEVTVTAVGFDLSNNASIPVTVSGVIDRIAPGPVE